MTGRRREARAAVLAACIVLIVTVEVRAVGGEGVKPKAPAPPEAPAPASPAPPAPPAPPHVGHPMFPSSATKRYYLAPGETHRGDQYFMSESVEIAGKQQGDLSVFARELTVSGTVTGDTNAWVQSAELNGTMGDSVRVFCQDVKVGGRVDGDLIAMCANVLVDRNAHVTGNLEAKGAHIEVRGKVDGDVDATGGEVIFSGSSDGDAKLKADVVQIDPGAKIAGSLEYASRERLDVDTSKVVKGDVTYSPEKPKHRHAGLHAAWWCFMITTLLTGLGMLALFRRSAPGIVGTVRTDGLRSAGIGFITAIVVPVAALISCILIITIPAAILVWIAWGILLYLSQVPVAVLLGETILGWLRRVAPSPFLSLLVGVPVLYLIFKIPVLGSLALFATIITGFGAIVIGIWTARQARRAVPAAPEPPFAPTPAV